MTPSTSPSSSPSTSTLANPVYPDEKARQLYEAHARAEAASKQARCDAPRCGWCGWLAPTHDARCLETTA